MSSFSTRGAVFVVLQLLLEDTGAKNRLSVAVDSTWPENGATFLVNVFM